MSTSSPSAESAPSVQDQSPLVLIVEDDADITLSLSIRLRHGGFRVASAASVDAGLAELERARPDVAILDMSIPGGDGISLLERIRARDATRDLPVIILTASMLPELETRALAAGAALFMRKPFVSKDLLDALSQLTK